MRTTLANVVASAGDGEAIPVYMVAWLSILMTSMAGVGALPYFYFKRIGRTASGLLNAVAIGVMVAASFDLINEGQRSGQMSTAMGTIVGALLVAWVHAFLDSHASHHNSFLGFGGGSGAKAKRALVIVGAMSVHALGEGFAVGVSFHGSMGWSSGLVMATAIGLHNIPEGAAVSTALMSRGAKPLQAFVWSILCALPQAFIAVPAYIFVSAFASWLPFMLGLGAGCMIWMVMAELAPEALEGAPSTWVATVATFAAVWLEVVQMWVSVLDSSGGMIDLDGSGPNAPVHILPYISGLLVATVAVVIMAIVIVVVMISVIYRSSPSSTTTARERFQSFPEATDPTATDTIPCDNEGRIILPMPVAQGALVSLGALSVIDVMVHRNLRLTHGTTVPVAVAGVLLGLASVGLGSGRLAVRADAWRRSHRLQLGVLDTTNTDIPAGANNAEEGMPPEVTFGGASTTTSTTLRGPEDSETTTDLHADQVMVGITRGLYPRVGGGRTRDHPPRVVPQPSHGARQRKVAGESHEEAGRLTPFHGGGQSAVQGQQNRGPEDLEGASPDQPLLGSSYPEQRSGYATRVPRGDMMMTDQEKEKNIELRDDFLYLIYSLCGPITNRVGAATLLQILGIILLAYPEGLLLAESVLIADLEDKMMSPYGVVLPAVLDAIPKAVACTTLVVFVVSRTGTGRPRPVRSIMLMVAGITVAIVALPPLLASGWVIQGAGQILRDPEGVAHGVSDRFDPRNVLGWAMALTGGGLCGAGIMGVLVHASDDVPPTTTSTSTSTTPAPPQIAVATNKAKPKHYGARNKRQRAVPVEGIGWAIGTAISLGCWILRHITCSLIEQCGIR